MMMHPQKSFRHSNLIRTNKCIHEITEYICRHTMRSSNRHLGFIIIIIDDASTVTVVIFHQLQGLGTIPLPQHPAACTPTENKSICQLDRLKKNTSHTFSHKMEHQVCTATTCMMCSMAGIMGTGQEGDAGSHSLQFTRFHTLQIFIWSSINSALFGCTVHVARKADKCTVMLREMYLPACLVQGIAGH
jgi:hypothetical protein